MPLQLRLRLRVRVKEKWRCVDSDSQRFTMRDFEFFISFEKFTLAFDSMCVNILWIV